MFSAQDILRYLGIAAAAIALIMAAFAARTYVVLDIRAVLDDLAGRSKGSSSRGTQRHGSRHSRPAIYGASRISESSDETNKPTDTALAEDQIATLVEDDISLPHMVPVSEVSYTMVMDEDELPTMVAGWSDDVTPTMVNEITENTDQELLETNYPGQVTTKVTENFVLTKRLVTLHSRSVVSAG